MLLNEDASAMRFRGAATVLDPCCASSCSCSAAAFRSAAMSRPVDDFLAGTLFLIIAQPAAARGELPPEPPGDVGDALPPRATRSSR